MESPWTSRNFAIYILGAGFSASAGLPLASELWQQIFDRASGHDKSLRMSHFDTDIEDFILYKKRSFGQSIKREEINFEEFLGYLDLEFHLGLRGSDTWSSDGNETQVIVKTLIGKILTERTPSVRKIPDLYLRFAEKLRPGDTVLTFNYDLLLERALQRVGVPFRLFPTRYKTIDRFGGGTIDPKDSEVVIIKLHGSVDWFDRQKYLDTNKLSGVAAPVTDPVFNSPLNLRTTPLADGPRPHDDPLKEMHRVIDIEKLYADPPFFLSTPAIILPSTQKAVFARQFRDFWWGMGATGSMNFNMAIIGYSLPEHDQYAHQVIYQMTKNYQNYHWGKPLGGKIKPPLKPIDLKSSRTAEKQYRHAYSFVNWRRATTYYGGFDINALRML
jgi:hypothetical protein